MGGSVEWWRRWREDVREEEAVRGVEEWGCVGEGRGSCVWFVPGV